MNTQEENNPKKNPANTGGGETMKDSMTESTVGNDNQQLPAAEDFTNSEGELDAEAFKKSYQQGTAQQQDQSDNK